MAALSLTSTELEDLDAFLLSGATSSSIMALDTLHGFLTATALGSPDMPPERWLQYIWGDGDGPTGPNRGTAVSLRISSYVNRMHDDIVAALNDPDSPFSPLVMVRKQRGKKYPDGEMWCYGFLQGMAFDAEAWTPLLNEPDGTILLRPIYLLGTNSGDDRRTTFTASQRAELTSSIPLTMEAIARRLFALKGAARRPRADFGEDIGQPPWLH